MFLPALLVLLLVLSTLLRMTETVIINSDEHHMGIVNGWGAGHIDCKEGANLLKTLRDLVSIRPQWLRVWIAPQPVYCANQVAQRGVQV
jgi:hypothetical protein